ncbi:delta-1-pyrroline-5-carboxylate dehydrogenase [Rhypophila decipiens]
MSTFAAFKVPKVANEPMHNYAKGSPQRASLTAAVETFHKQGAIDVPLVVGGKEIKTSATRTQINPADHNVAVATYSQAEPQHVRDAIDAALAAKSEWESLPFADRAAVFLKAADLVSNKYRYDIMAATILGQGKNAWQAEIDTAAELCDFFRFNVKYAEELYSQQPEHNSPGMWNRVEYRPLEGFVYAVSPFNFTAIAGNLPGVPALMGNVVVWKPSDSAIASNWLLYNILLEAGLPKNVIQFVPGNPEEVTKEVLAHRQFAALHYTGSTAVFRKLYGQIGAGVAEGRYQSYPRIVGETGGKNFHLIHSSADIENAVVQTVRGAFEYQGQKCSAASRLYVPASIWPKFKARLVEETEKLTVGNPWEHKNFIGPVIHAASFKKLSGAIDEAKNDSDLELLTGGTYDDTRGFFIQPTIYEARSPTHKLFSTELFGPILTAYVYDDTKDPVKAFASVCELVDSTSDYGLTGSVFASDRAAVRFAEEKLRNSAGNFYVNCKSTGAVVGQQPFGGSRASGTNDKAGSSNIISRFVSMRSIKEEFNATTRMPRATLPPTPGSSTDMKGRDGSKLATLQISFELPPPAMISADGSPNSMRAPGPSPYPTQPSETVKSRRRSSTLQGPTKDKDQFALPPPPTRSRKIIQMKPREESPQEARPSTKAAASAPKNNNTSAAAPPAVAGTKRKQPSTTSAAGRKIARKTAHSLIERRRRSKMNEEFAVLKNMIPACTGEMHKLAILQASIEYVRYLEDCVAKLKAQCGEDSGSRATDTSLPSPTRLEPYNPDRNYTHMTDVNSPDVEMTSSDIASPTFTHSAGRSNQPSVSPALLAEDMRDRHNSHSSISTEYRHHNRYSVSANTSPNFGPQAHGYAPSIHSASGSTLPSPALIPQRDLDQEATAALLMLNQADRRHSSTNTSGSVSAGRGMSVRDLLST